jgi:hypothetical protein
MFRIRLLALIAFVSSNCFGQNGDIKRYKTDTTLIYKKEVKLYEFVLEGKKQGLFWDTLKSIAFTNTSFKVKNNTGQIIILKRVRQEDGTITFFADSPNKIIYPDSSIHITMICSKRYGPFTRSVWITYMKGKEEKQSSITTWGWYGVPPQITPPTEASLDTAKPAFVHPRHKTIVTDTKPPVKDNAANGSAKKEFFMGVMNGEENITADTYIIHKQDTIRSSFFEKEGLFCFQLKVSRAEVWPIKLFTKHHGVYKTSILFYKIPMSDNSFSIYLPKEGELLRYTSKFTKLHEAQVSKALGDNAFKDYFITLISGTENITADSYLLIKGKKIRSTLHDAIGMCFKLRAKPSDAWPVKIITKKHDVYNTTVFFNRANFCIRVPNAGEKYHYSGSFIMLNPIHKGYYFIKAPTVDDYRAIKDILEKKHLQVLDIHNKSASDRVILQNDSAAAQFEKELRANGIKATLEPGTEWRGVMCEMENGKVVYVAKAYVEFNAGTSDQWITAMLKRFGNVTYSGYRASDCSNCPVYYITVHSNLYKEYMAVFDQLWNMKEVKHLEQLTVAEAD